jgi:hypothetical protein
MGISGNAFEFFSKAGSMFSYYLATREIAEINGTGTATSLKLFGDEGGPAYIDLCADQSDDSGDDWRLRSDHTTNNFMLQNDTSGAQITKLSVTTTGILGIDHIAELTALHGLVLDNAVTCASTLTITTIANAAGNILTHNAGLVNQRTAAQILGDIGGQPVDADLTAIAALAGTGILCHTAANTWAERTITSTAGFTVTNPGGVAGNIDIGLTTDAVRLGTLALGAALIAGATLSTGDTTPAATATPRNINLGGTYGNAVGNDDMLKLYLYDGGGANNSGFALNATALEYHSNVGEQAWYYTEILKMKLTHSGTATTLTLYGADTGPAQLELWADRGDDNADKWVLRVPDGGTLLFRTYNSGAYITALTLNNDLSVACASTLQATRGGFGTAPDADHLIKTLATTSAKGVLIDSDATHWGAIVLASNGTGYALVGAPVAGGDIITGSAIGDLCIRSQGKSIRFSGDSGTTTHATMSAAGAWTMASTLEVTGSLFVNGDSGGKAGCVTFCDVADVAARSTGVGTILFDDGTNRNSDGFIKVYVGTSAYYVPIFFTIT